jgi:hypothetical protein
MMSELEMMGVAITRKFLSSSTSVNGIEMSSSETTKLTLTLPRATPIQATFSKEGLGRKLLKIFKKELQTGDATFDAAIFISTDTPDATKAFLEAEDVRGAIATCVCAAGPVEIESTSLTLEVPGREEGEPAEAIVLARGLLR